jgi:hypothetical protein
VCPRIAASGPPPKSALQFDNDHNDDDDNDDDDHGDGDVMIVQTD